MKPKQKNLTIFYEYPYSSYMNRHYFLIVLAIAFSWMPKQVMAHGANIEYQATKAIKIQAKYDDGKPMANAQVVIYAPSDRASPWLTGTTDNLGNFTFVPDLSTENLGNWDVKVRQSGHGDITSIPLEQDRLAIHQMTAFTGHHSYTIAHKLIMAAAVGWGLVGTGLFFSRSKSK